MTTIFMLIVVAFSRKIRNAKHAVNVLFLAAFVACAVTDWILIIRAIETINF